MSSTPLDDLLLPGRTLREVAPRIYSARPQADEGAAYDSRAAAYDRMVSSDLYLKIAWGARRSTIHPTRSSSAPSRRVLELVLCIIASSSRLKTAPTHAGYPAVLRPP